MGWKHFKDRLPVHLSGIHIFYEVFKNLWWQQSEISNIDQICIKWSSFVRKTLMASVNSFKIMMTKKLSRLFEHKYWNGWQSLMSALCFIGTRVHHSVVTGYNDIMKDHNFWAYRDCLPWNFSYCYNKYFFHFFIKLILSFTFQFSFSFWFDNVSKLNQ